MSRADHTDDGTADRTLTLRRHADVVTAALDPLTFASAVSSHLQVPNSLDGAVHARARRLLDPFFAPAPMAVLEPGLVELAASLVADCAAREGFGAVSDLGTPFAVRAQSQWLGWSADLEHELVDWVADNRAATRSGDPARTAVVAGQFDTIIRGILDERRHRRTSGAIDVTDELLALRDETGRGFTDAELVSILRNWTGGDLASIALCVGVIVHWLGEHQQHQGHLAAANDAQLDAAIDEILRIDDPFIANRRVATHATEIGGCPVSAGDRVVLDWASANRDPAAFGDPDACEPAANAEGNLVYGIGVHVCPGRPLATLQLRILVRALLAAGRVELIPGAIAERETPPAGGFRVVPARIIAH